MLRILVILLSASSMMSVIGPAAAQTYDNNELRDQITAIGAAHNLAFGPSLSPEPISAIVGGSTTYATNFGLKYIPPVLLAPGTVGRLPNTADGCGYIFTITGDAVKTRQDFLGIAQSYDDDFEWTDFLGSPDVYHVNTDVDVSMYFGDNELSGNVTLPVGSHSLRWQGQTLVTPILDFPPWHLIMGEIVEASARKAVIGLKTPAARRAVMQGAIELFLNLGIEGATAGVDWFLLDAVPTPASGWEVVNNQFQKVLIYDRTTPQFQITTPQITVEATQVGGEYLRDHIARLRDGFTVTDTCDREPSVNYSGPPFMPVGETTEVTWTARDAGPVDINGGFNSRTMVQRVIVQDTLPPILLPPPGRVIESDTAMSLDLGNAAVFDLADVRPLVGNDAPASYDPNTRTLVTWTAEDASGNTTSMNQWVTLKTPGSNTAPTANAQILDALTFEPVEIELTGSDPDLLSGRYDQLTFSIVEQPANGFFVAPLFPYFIEDYRVENEFGLSKPDLDAYLDQQCASDPNNFVPPVDFVTDPRYITVDDDGVTYVSDNYLKCNKSTGKIERDRRIARFLKDADGVLHYDTHLDLGSENAETLHIGANGSVYYPGVRVDSSTSVLRGCNADLADCEVYRIATDTSTANPDRLLPVREPTSVVVDANNVMFVTDGQRALAAYDLNQVDNNYPALLGPVAAVGDFANSGQPYKDLVMDSLGNIYVSDSTLDRVYKFSPSTTTRNADGEVGFEPGQLIGWMGRCETNLTSERACDEVAGKSYGYTCDATRCGVSETSGNAPGQFNRPRGIAINARDILYVTDFENFRVQRFTPEGFFAGEAQSECDGSCFVLGDFGKPEDVSVNLDYFYVLDKERDLLHVFETTPITDFDDDTLQPLQTARVTYQSDDHFKGIDTFRFGVSDGLDDSPAATVTVNVSRNYRPPIATENQVFTVNEDETLDFTIAAFDPDADDLANLTVTIESQPENGNITGSGRDFSYTPNPNFFGSDTFTFSVSDGGMQSETVAARIDVAPVNDPPELRFGNMADRFGSGFPIKAEVLLTDVDLSDRHVYGIDWGPGRRYRSGRALPPGQVAANDEPTFIQAADGIGVLIDEKTFFRNEVATVTVCVSDEPGLARLPSCNDSRVTARASRTITIDSMVSKAVVITDTAPAEADALGNEYPAEIVDGESFDILFALHNLEPNDVGIVLDATDVVFRATLGEGLVIAPAGIIGTSGNAGTIDCLSSAQQLDCTISSIPNGGQARIGIQVIGNGRIAEESHVPVVAIVSSAEEDHNGMVGASRNYKLVANPDGDADGDGVINRDDAFPADPSESSDFDADGIGDNADPDDDNDAMPDLWERRFGLDPFDSADAGADGDGDQLSNAAEYAKGTRPDTDDSDLDQSKDGVDNCVVVANRNQYDNDADGRGDACDPDQFAASVALGNLDGAGGNDYALVRTASGVSEAFLKDAASDYSVGADRLNLGSVSDIAMFSVMRSTDVLLTLGQLTDDGSWMLSGVDALAGNARFSTTAFPAGWQVHAATAAGQEVWVIASSAAGDVEVRRFAAADGESLGQFNQARETLPVGLRVFDEETALVLSEDAASGEWLVKVVRMVDGATLATAIVASAEVISVQLQPLADGFATVAQATSGVSSLDVWDPQGVPVSSAAVFKSEWTILGMAAVPEWSGAGNAIAIAAFASDGTLEVRTVSVADGALVATRNFGSSSLGFRSMDGAATSGNSEIGLLLVDAANGITFELQNADGADANSRILTAASASPPPPPPPPPPVDHGSGGGGGGGGTGMLFPILLGLAAIRLRHRQRKKY